MRVVALLTLGLASPALAGTHVHIAASHEWGVPMSAEGSPLGPGIAAHIGPSFSLKIARLIPEIGATYHYESGVVVPRAGGRLIIGWIITPGVYAHANAAIGGPFAEPAPGFDAGLSAHLSIPFVRVGGYGGIEVFGGESGPGIPDQNFIGGLEIALSIPTSKKLSDEEVDAIIEPSEPLEPEPLPSPVPTPVPSGP